jgi:hypothetical protein
VLAKGGQIVGVKRPEQAAVEFAENDVNGAVVAPTSPRHFSDAILRVRAAGQARRESTTGFFVQYRESLPPEAPLGVVTRRGDRND